MRGKALLLTSALLLASCGGGGGSVPNPTGGTGGTNYFAGVKSLQVSSQNLSEGDTFTVSWEVVYSSPTGLYTFSAYLSPTTEVPKPTYNGQLFYRNCGSGSFYTCNSKGSVTCTYRQKLQGVPVFDCSSSAKSVNFTGSGYLVVEACVYDASLNLVCNRKAVPVTVN